MNDQPPQVPPAAVEVPNSEDTESGELEKATLERLASSSNLRDVYERRQHVTALSSRIEVLQTKLNERETELRKSLPRVAELEQASRTSRLGTIVEAVGGGGGALCLSIATLTSDLSWWQFFLAGIGVGAVFIGIGGKALGDGFGWPPKN